jgi:hypothetical protein
MKIEILAKGSAGQDGDFFGVDENLPQKHFFLTIIGSRGSGKSVLTTNLLDQFYVKNFDYIIVLCPTYNLNGDYKWLEKRENPKHYFFDKTGEYKSIIEEIIKSQKDIILDKSENGGRKNCPNVLLIADDCINARIFHQHGVIEELAALGRHLKISTVIISQSMTKVSRVIRLNSDMIFLFPTVNMSETERFLEEYVYKRQKKYVLKAIEDIFSKEYNFISCKRNDRELKEGADFKKIDLEKYK